MVKITCYGGVSEIGGNKILVEHQGSRIMLDFGRRMGFESNFFSEFLGVRTNTQLKDMITIGALPILPGIYREELICPNGVKNLLNDEYKCVLNPNSGFFNIPGLLTYEEYLKKNDHPYLDAILLSHAHLDHTGDIIFLHPDIPLYCSKTTRILVEAIDDITSFKSEAIKTKSRELGFNTGGFFPRSPKIVKKELKRKCKVMSNGISEKIGQFSVTMLNVDHSVPGASSFLLECNKSSGNTFRLLYTGDIRFHGSLLTTIDRYVQDIGESIDVMICEGTRIGSESKLTEQEVKEKIKRDIKRTEALVFVDFSWKDTTRYETIKEASEESGRIFIINARLAYLLNKLGKTPLPPSVKVFLKRKESCLYSPADYSRSKHEFGLSVDWKNDFDSSHYDEGITAEEVRNRPKKYVLMMSYFDLNQLFDLAGDRGKLPGSRFIKAVCEPFCDEMELDEERLINWLDTFEIQFEEGEKEIPSECNNNSCTKIKRRIERAHVSGHASKPELIELITKLSPKRVIPVHTENERVFEEELKGKGIEVILPEYEKSIELG